MEGVENFRDSELQTFSHLFLPSLFSLSRDLPFLLAISWGWIERKRKNTFRGGNEYEKFMIFESPIFRERERVISNLLI